MLKENEFFPDPFDTLNEDFEQHKKGEYERRMSKE